MSAFIHVIWDFSGFLIHTPKNTIFIKLLWWKVTKKMVNMFNFTQVTSLPIKCQANMPPIHTSCVKIFMICQYIFAYCLAYTLDNSNVL